MSKVFDIFMAGIISGIVAYTTTQLGVGGTVIGAVLGSILYQMMSHFLKEPLGKVQTQKIESGMVYVLPLLLIVGIEIIYLMVPIHSKSEQIFYFLEGATDWNLFRFIGIGLIVMGIYPILQSEFIKKQYGFLLSALGIVVLLRGFLDWDSPLISLYSKIYVQFDSFISLMIIFVLSYVIISILNEALTLIRRNNAIDTTNEKSENKNKNQDIDEE
jgi:large-conductance mechanosensitive channel